MDSIKELVKVEFHVRCSMFHGELTIDVPDEFYAPVTTISLVASGAK